MWFNVLSFRVVGAGAPEKRENLPYFGIEWIHTHTKKKKECY